MTRTIGANESPSKAVFFVRKPRPEAVHELNVSHYYTAHWRRFSAPPTVVVKSHVRNVWDQYTLQTNPSLDILGVHNRGRTSGNCVENFQNWTLKLSERRTVLRHPVGG